MQILTSEQVWEMVKTVLPLVGLTIFVVVLVLFGIYAWRRWGKRLIEKPSPAPLPPPDPAVEAMERVTRLLSVIEPNTAKAEAQLRDARMATQTLMSQVLKVVERIESLERQAGYITEAVEAIHSGSREQVAYIAGKVGDDSLRQMLLSPYVCGREDFRSEAFILLANERGTLEECAAGYGRLVTALCGQLAQARTRVTGLEQSVVMLEASHPILLIEQGLSKSIDALNLRATPALRWTAKQALPVGVAGYLKGQIS